MTHKYHSVKGFAQLTGLSEEYIRQCCRRQKIGPSQSVRIPDGYKSIKGRDWRIFKQESTREQNIQDNPVLKMDKQNCFQSYLASMLAHLFKMPSGSEKKIFSILEPHYKDLIRSISREELSKTLLEDWWINGVIRAGLQECSDPVPFETGMQLLEQLGEAYMLCNRLKERSNNLDSI